MPLSIVNNTANSYYRSFKLRTFLHCIPKALITRRNKFFWNNTTFCHIYKVVFLNLFVNFHFNRLNITGNTSILSCSSGLLFVSIVEFGFLSDCLTICNLRTSCFYFTFVFALHSFKIYIQVKLSHTLDNSLVGFGVNIALECRIFLCKAVQSFCHLIRTLFVFRINCKRYYRCWNIHRRH